MPVAGVEPARCRHRWILNPVRLPIPSHRLIYIFFAVAGCVSCITPRKKPGNWRSFWRSFWKTRNFQSSKPYKNLGFSRGRDCQTKRILSPARLPIPSHRQNTSSEILPYLHDYFNPKYEVCGAILLIFTAYQNRSCRKSDISEISILLFCLISFDIYVKIKCEGR